MRYIISIERDPFPDPQGGRKNAWCSQVSDADTGLVIDGEGDLPDFSTARDLAMNLLASLVANEPPQ